MTFKELNIIQPILKAIEEKGYNRPTPIQQQAIPVALSRKDILGCAQTGTGKTASFSFIRECMAVNPDIVCINYQDYQKDIKKLIASETGKLVVIANADILLDDEIRKYISLDDKNQYLIIGRNPKNLFTTSDNLFELVSEKKGEQTEFRLRKYL